MQNCNEEDNTKLSFRESLVSQKELNECDRVDLRLMGRIQGDTANVFFIDHPDNVVTAVDAKILSLPFVRWQHACDTAIGTTTTQTNTSGNANGTTNSNATRNSNGTTTANGDKKEISVSDLLGDPLENWIPKTIFARVQSVIRDMKRQATMQGFAFFTHEGAFYAVSISTNKADHSEIGIEFEQMDDDTASASLHSALVFLRQVMDFQQGGGENAAIVACDIMFELIGKYDRAMVYRFHDDLSGEVIHEVKSDDVETSYLGLRFPASDIPQSSRMLYLKNILRYIRDSGAEDVPLLSQDDNAAQVDLTQIRSRSVHKAHIEYMKNMGVVSSMSLAVVVDGDLWGLLAFHGLRDPIKPSLHQRVACETIATMVSTRVEALIRKEQNSRIVRFGDLMMKWNHASPVRTNLENLGDQILMFLQANVLVGRVQDVETKEIHQVVKGDTSLGPSEAFWEKMSTTMPNRQLCVVSRKEDMDRLGITKKDCPSAGFLYFHEGQTQLMMGRAWRSRDVKWGGRPSKPKPREGGGLRPRESFEIFLQKAMTESRAWNPSDQTIAEIFRDRFCLEQSHSWMLALLKNDVDEANVRYFNALERSDDNSEFFASLCHELRTPLHGVISSLNMLHESLKAMSEDEVKDLVKTSLTSGNHMIALLNDILSRSKNKYLASTTARDVVILQELTSDAVDGMRNLAKSVSTTVKVEVHPEDDICVVIDRTKTTQILTNVINNGIKFAGPSGRVGVMVNVVEDLDNAISVWEGEAAQYKSSVCVMRQEQMFESVEAVKERIASFNTNKSQHYACVSISDTGPGMSASDMIKVFEPYTQLKSSINHTTTKGTGLGLFICMSLVRQLDGFIACSSTVKGGTTFFIGIPVDIAGLEDIRVEGPDQLQEKDVIIRGPILIVDDSKVNLKILSRQLDLEFKKRGLRLEVISALGGREAVQCFQERLPSLLIVDYHMPEMDGIETMSAIRGIEGSQGLPRSFILSYTADASEKAHNLLLAAGADEIMSKPPPKDFISRLVNRFRMDASSTAATLCQV